MRKTNLSLVSLALASLSLLTSQAALADGSTMEVESRGGIKVFNSEDEGYYFALGGRLHSDLVMFSGSRVSRQQYPSGTNIRRASLYAKGGLGCHFSYQVGLDLDTGGASVFQETFIAYNGFKNLWIAIGQVALPISMENWTSGNSTTFMEAALPVSALASPAPELGVYVSMTGDILAGAVAVTTLTDETPASVLPIPVAGGTAPLPGSDPLTITGRLHFSPVHTPDTVYHFGVSAMYSDLHNQHNQVAWNTRPEMRARTTPVISTAVPGINVVTGAGGVANNFNTMGGELAGKWGPLSGQAEYIHTRVNARGGDFSFKGYYGQVAYVLTGESREYDFKTGTFGRVKPDSRMGAWEVAARFSFVDLRDRQFGAGNEHNSTLGLNWWVNDHIRFTGNYVRARLPPLVPGTPTTLPVGSKRRVDIWGFRAQANW